jgi:sugar phosphate isomerase/epimerase
MRLSLQLFTVRDAMGADLDGTLSAIRETGLDYVELAGFYGKTATEFSAVLKSHGLKPSGSHVGIEVLEQGFEGLVADCKILGNEWVIVPWISENRRNWAELGQSLNAFGKKLSNEGLRLAYHNHDFEFRQDQGLRQLIAATDPELVSFQVDLGWVRFAGEDPAKFLLDNRSRVPIVHLKDMAPDRENPHVVAGDGAVDWTSVIAACVETGVQFGAIEMDMPPNDPVDDVRRCVRYFQERGIH